MVRRSCVGLVAVSIVLAGCSGKKRPFADGVGGSSATEIEQLTPDAMAPGSNSGTPASAESSVGDPMLLAPEPGESSTMLDCGSGTHICGNSCVSDFEVASCGDSCESCVIPEGGTVACDGIACVDLCPPGLRSCRARCIDVESSCEGTCPDGSHACGETCSLNVSPDSCGDSCSPCPSPANGAATCDGSGCGFSCNPGFHACGDTCVSALDVQTCGLSCEACPVPVSGTATCDGVICGGACEVGFRLCAGGCISDGQACEGECPLGTHDCGGTCQSNSGVNSCGDRCVPCPSPTGNGEATCNGAACGIVCAAGSRLCRDACFANNSAQACGANCTVCPIPSGGSATCNAGVCGVSCPQGSNLCGSTCVPDGPSSCGANCQICLAPQGSGSATCVNGTCGIACAAGSHRCGNSCVSNSSVSSCGSACSPCPLPASDGQATCNGTSCSIACDDGFELRSGSCRRIPTEVFAGGSTTCVLMSDGTIECWGSNFNGELGTRAPDNTSSTPVQVAGLGRVRGVSVGDGGICAILDTDGSVRCWGTNVDGALGAGSSVATSSVPLQVTGIARAIDVSTSGIHACAVLDDGSIRCWGRNEYGALGNGSSGGSSSTPVTLANLGGQAVAVGAGPIATKSCAVLSNGMVRCWGLRAPRFGILGDGLSTANQEPATGPVTVSGINNATAINVRAENVAALLSNGAVRGWGTNESGVLGDGTETEALAPVAVMGLSGSRRLALQDFAGCAVTASGGVQCWGSNFRGALGNGDIDEFSTSLTRVDVVNLTNVRSLSSGSTHTCAIDGNDVVKCWGNNNFGQLGNGSFDTAHAPTVVSGL